MALFSLRPGRQVRSGSFWAELPCPLEASHGLGRRDPDPGSPGDAGHDQR